MSNQKSIQIIKNLQQFIEIPLNTVLDSSIEPSPEDKVLALFDKVVESVPAYKQFLQDHGIDPEIIKSIDDFKILPYLTKENYLYHYPLPQLCCDGQLTNCDMVAVSSGSTGRPTFWPRFVSHELSVAARFEQVFKDSFQSHKTSTLAVICFPLGTWVGGLYTLNCCRHLALKGYPITLVAPGNNKEEIFRVVTELGSHFEQIVLLGYPPFMKDVIDNGLAQGIDWATYHPKFIFAGEVFSEAWRNLICHRASTPHPHLATASLYGTADAGVLGNETPLSIVIRQFLAEHPNCATELFGEARLPTLVQYDPRNRFFEVDNGTLLFSGDNGVPLIRYNIKDSGGIISYTDMLTYLSKWNFDPLQTEQLQQVESLHKLPFVWVFGRSFFAVSYYGANVYPENVTVGLEQKEFSTWITGKFVLEVVEGADQESILQITIECGVNVDPDEAMIEPLAQSIVHHLSRLNSEYKNYVPAEHQTPHIQLKPYGDPEYFPLGVKHRYTRH